MSLRIIKYVDWIFEAIGRTLHHMFFVCVIMVPVLLAFAVYLWFHMGQSISGLSNFYQAFFTVYRFLLGICDTAAYMKISPIFFQFWSFAVTIVYFYLFLPVSIAVLLDSFDIVIKESGHVSDSTQNIGVSYLA